MVKAVNSDCDAAIRGRALRLASVYARRRHGGIRNHAAGRIGGIDCSHVTESENNDGGC